MPSRRTFLRAAAVVGGAGVAGCGGPIGGHDEPERQVSVEAGRGDGPDDVSVPRERPTEAWREDVGDVWSVAVADGTVYHAVGDGDTVYARRLSDGRVQWQTDAPTDGLTCVDGRLYATTEETVVALDAADGTEIWRTAVRSGSSDPVASEALGFVFVEWSGAIAALHADTGAQLWTVEVDDFFETAVTERGLLVAGQEAAAWYAVERTRPPRGREPTVRWERGYLRRTFPSLSVADGTAWIGGRTPEGPVSLVGFRTDRAQATAVSGHDGGVRVSPAPDGRVVEEFGTDERDWGRLTALTVAGSTRWTRSFDTNLGTHVADGVVLASPFADDDGVVALDFASGEPLWRLGPESATGGTPTPAGLLAVTPDGLALYE